MSAPLPRNYRIVSPTFSKVAVSILTSIAGIFLILGLSFAASAVYAPKSHAATYNGYTLSTVSSYGDVLYHAPQDLDNQIFYDVNAIRASYGLNPLIWAPDMEAGARNWSYTQASWRDISHEDSFTDYNAENVAMGPLEEGAYNLAYDYMTSPSHAAAIVSPRARYFTSITVYNEAENAYYNTMRFRY